MDRASAKRRRRAFTLLELLVATTLALVVIAAASTAIFILIRALNRSGQSSAADTESQLFAEYLTSQLQSVGGGPVRPWMVFDLQNNAGEGSSDIVTFADTPGDLPQAATVASLIAPGTYSFFVPTGFDRSGRLVGRCALADLRKDLDNDGFAEPIANTGAAFSVAELRGSQVILTSPTGESWRSVVLRDVGMDPSELGCFARFDVVSRGLDANGALRDADRFDTDDAGVEIADQWVLGQMAFVRVREWRLRGKAVVERVMTNTTIERTLFEGALDLQVAAGYDYLPFDGNVVETADGRGDEWLNNDPSESLARVPRDLRNLDPDVPVDALRMLDVEIVIALPRAERVITVRALDGAPRTGPEARVARGRAYLRNLLLFL